MVWSWYAIAGALLLAGSCSFFFALAESALFALGKWRAQQIAEEYPVAGKRVAALFSEPQDLLATLVLGNTLANGLLIGTTAWILAHSYLSQPLAIIAMFLFILIGCEVIPKALGVRAPEFWALRIAGIMHGVARLTSPIRKVAQTANESLLRFVTPKVNPQPAISEEEYQELLDIAQQQGALGKSERDIILQILSLDERTASDVMRPRAQISFIPDDLSKEEMLEQARALKHSRLPMYDETPDTIIGVLNARAFLLDPSRDLEEVIEFPSFVPASMNLLQLLRSLQRQQRGIAIVLDEFGGTAGLVTMEDILQDTLGSFQRRNPLTFTYERLGPGRWRVNGSCPIDEFRREHLALQEQDDVDTMGGLLVRLIEYVPAQGESAHHAGLKLTAQKVDDRRVLELLVEVAKK